MPSVLLAWRIEENSSRPHTLFRWTERSETGTTKSVATNTTESPQMTLLEKGIVASVSGLILLGITIWVVIRFLRRKAQGERAAFLLTRGLRESGGMVQNCEKGLSE